MNLFEAILAITLYANKPTIVPTQQPAVVEQKNADPRISQIRGVFDAYHSPLVGTEQKFLDVAKAYDLDWKLLPAIAGVESGFETAGNTSDHNPFGYMCKSGPCAFDSFDEAIERVGRTIGTGRAYSSYRESGSLSVLAKIYNYVSPEDWTSKIIYFQNKLK